MTKHDSWLAPVVLALFAALVLSAPVLSQEKARLVNPKKKAEAKTTTEVAPEEDPAAAKAARKAAKKEQKDARREAKQAEAENSREEPAVAVTPPTAPTPARKVSPEPTALPEPAARAAAPAPKPEPRKVVAPTDRTATPAATAPKPAARAADVVRDRIVVTEVLLDVLVTDKQGNVVTGLGPDDFVVNEEGKSQPVTGATFYGSSEELRGSGIAGEVRSDRYFIFMVHDLRQILPELLAAQIDLARWAKRWVEEEMLPNDQVAVVSYNNRLKLYQDFTRDPAAVAKAIEKAALGKKELDLFKTRSAPTFDPDSPSLFVNLPTGKELMRQTLKLQEALGLLGRAAEGIVGRKNLMLFSLGWDDPEESLSGWIPDPRYYPEMKESLNAGNVAVYSIDLLGSRRGGFSSQSSINDSLSSISNDTGGHYYYNFTNALTPLRQVAEDNQGYYLLSYSSEYPNGQKGYREVEIETRNKDYKVRARKGYRYGNNQGGS